MMFKAVLVAAYLALATARKVEFTYYWIAYQSDYAAGSEKALKDCDGHTIAHVSKDFAKNLKLECSGRLNDGRYLNGGDDDCSCFEIVDGPKGSHDNTLKRYVSIGK